MCRTYEDAKRFYHATIDFLSKRLGLEVNPDKSKVVNLKKNSSNFLGFKVKVVKQGKSKYGYIAKSSMSDKAINKTKHILKERIKDIQKSTLSDKVVIFNTTLIGIQNYFKYATTVYMDLTEISYSLLKAIKARLHRYAKIKRFSEMPMSVKKRLKGIKADTKIMMIQDTPIFPITGIHHKNPRNFSQDICNYTKKGRSIIHNNLKAMPRDVLSQVMTTYSKFKSIEYNDNRISKYVAQYGKCFILGEVIGIDRVHCHHIVPVSLGGKDNYSNLVIVDWLIHKLIHMTNFQKISEILRTLSIGKNQLAKLNQLRSKAGNEPIAV